MFNSLYFTPNVKFVIHKSVKLHPTTFRSMLGNASARVTSETTFELCWNLEMKKKIIRYFFPVSLGSIITKIENSTQLM